MVKIAEATPDLPNPPRKSLILQYGKRIPESLPLGVQTFLKTPPSIQRIGGEAKLKQYLN